MPKYDPLANHLRAHSGDVCRLYFADIERIIGAALPRSARKHRAWWGNDLAHVQASAWMDAGFRAEPAPVRMEPVVFRRRTELPDRAAPGAARPLPAQPGPTQVIVRNIEPDVVAALKLRAVRNGRSLEKELRILLTREARPSRRDLIAEADRIRAMTPGPLPDSADLLREDRDRR